MGQESRGDLKEEFRPKSMFKLGRGAESRPPKKQVHEYHIHESRVLEFELELMSLLLTSRRAAVSLYKRSIQIVYTNVMKKHAREAH